MTEQDLDLTGLTAIQLLDGYRKGEFSPVDVTRATLARAERIQPEVNAFVRLTADEALVQAAASADRWRRGEAGRSAGRRAGHGEGHPAAARGTDPQGFQNHLRAGPLGGGRSVRRPSARARRGLRRQDDDPRVRLEGRDGLTPVRRHPQPARPDPHRGRLQRRRGGGRGAGRGTAGPRHGRRWQRPYPGGLLRDLRAEADVRPCPALPRERLRHPRPRGAHDPRRGGRGATPRRHRHPGLPRLVGPRLAARLLRGGPRGRGAWPARRVLALPRRPGRRPAAWSRRRSGGRWNASRNSARTSRRPTPTSPTRWTPSTPCGSAARPG